MTPEQTGKAYDSITGLWTRPEFNSENGTSSYRHALAFLPSHLLNGTHFALDIGCGCTNRFVPIIEDKKLVYEGVDISNNMLDIARKSLPEHTFYYHDICSFNFPKQYAFISAWDSLWHVPLHQQEALLVTLCHQLEAGGVLMFSCGGVDEAGCHTNQAMGPEVYYASLGINGYVSLLVDAGMFIRHINYDQYPEQHTVIIAQKP
ncbi:MAG: methyltransferase type 11 [Alteromonas sp. Nap_26]|nr:MAG: methyltransferase type 11 [Alteromonas sp. Nap_26]